MLTHSYCNSPFTREFYEPAVMIELIATMHRLSSKLVLLGLLFITPVGSAAAQSAQPQTEQQLTIEVERLAREEPSLGRILKALKSNFPDNYYGLIRRVASASATGAGSEKARNMGFATAQAFVAANVRNIADAPTPLLVAYSTEMVRMFETLSRENEIVCARLAIGDRRPSERISPAMAEATASMAVTMIQAARAGIDHPAGRSYITIADDIAADYVQALNRLDPTAKTLDLIRSPKRMTLANRREQCAAGLLNARAIASLPAESTAALSAFMMIP